MTKRQTKTDFAVLVDAVIALDKRTNADMTIVAQIVEQMLRLNDVTNQLVQTVEQLERDVSTIKGSYRSWRSTK